MKQLDLSIIVPVYNEAQNVDPLLARLLPVLERLTPTFQVLFVDDGSTDDTARLVRMASTREPRVELLSLARNFGHQVALTAGLDHARGDVVISMDGDLQHPPEMIPQMIDLYHEGNDVVYTVRRASGGESVGKRMSSAMFYRLFNFLSPVRIQQASSDFRLLSRHAVDVLSSLPERHRFLRGLIPWTGFRSASVPYEAEPRHAGKAKYSTMRSLSMALDAAFSFSRVPLQLATLLGLLTTLACLVYFLVCVAVWWEGGTVTGWTSLIASVLFIGGVQLTFVGILGEYVGRIYEEVKRRPLYVVQEYHGALPTAGSGEKSFERMTTGGL
jgi:dolichol-phosphate mannosyltransferase